MDYGVDIKNFFDYTNYDNPLVVAIKNKQQDMVKYLISHGADLNLKYNGRTLTELAIDIGNEEILNYLIDKGIKLKINTKNYTPLTYAIQTKNLKIVKCLMDSNKINMNIFINLGNKGTTSLLMAVESEDIHMIKYLIEHGADLNQYQQCKQKDGNIILINPLICAINKLNENIIQYLVEEGGANISLLNQNSYILYNAIDDSNIDIIKYLVKFHVDINKKNKSGGTPLIYALHKYPLDVQLIKYLIENGANINAIDNNNDSPLIHIIKYFHLKNNERNKIIKYLIDQGAELNIKDIDGKSVLQLAKEYCNKTMINYMIKHRH